MSGKCSQICTPATLVLVGLNLPRTSAGASGFMSQVSCWPGEPTRKMVMQLRIGPGFSLVPPAASTLKSVGRDRPTTPADPIWRKLRRETPSHSRTFSRPTFSMRRLPGLDLVLDLIRHVDELAGRELAVGPLGVAHVLPHLEDDFVLAGGGVRVLVGHGGPGGDVGHDLAVLLDDPLQEQAPVVGHVGARDLAAVEAQLGLG